MKKIFLILLALIPFWGIAQNINDVYNIASTYYQGTAKSAAMGNAMGAVGQDFSSLSINPAGLGLYRKPTIEFTPSIKTSYAKTDYYGNTTTNSQATMAVNSFGIVGINNSGENVINWAFGMNRTNDFSNAIFVNGINPHHSLIDAYFQEIIANDIYNEEQLYEYSPSYIYPIWETYLFDFNNDGSLTAYVPEGGLLQSKGTNTRGGINEWTISTSINFSDKVYLGASINMPSVNYRKLTEYAEDFKIDNEYYSWAQYESLTTTGWGLNGKIGIIAYPCQWLRVGATFHTPTVYNLSDRWRTETYSWVTQYNIPTSYFNYSMKTPWKLGGSAAFIFGNFGMITADVEYIDYSSIRLSAYNYDYSSYNDMVQSTLKPSMNLRLGTEWRYQSMCFRGGYSFYGSPYGIKLNDGYYNYNNRNALSCGIGYTQHMFTIDLAYVYTLQKNSYNLYSQYTSYYDMLEEQNVVYERSNFHSMIVSLKMKL